MTSYEISSIVLSIMAIIVASSAALIYHGQVREMMRQNASLAGALRIATTDTLEAGFARITDAFLAYPDLRAIFYEDEATGATTASNTGDMFLRANAIAESTLSLFSSAYRLSGEGDVAELPWFVEYVKGSFLNSSHLRRYALQRRTWSDPRVIIIAEQAESAMRMLNETDL
jgi:hypothetical protein